MDLTPSPLLTLSTAAAAGVGLIVLAERLSIPSIALLLLGGVLLGPEVLGWVHPDALGHGLETVVALAVAVILFEGGLTLDLIGYRRASQAIKRMLTVGVLITWMGSTLGAYLLLGVSFRLALLAGALVIVTGPTVISPLLRRIGVKDRVHHTLYWEAVLIDAVGVFIAVLCYEWVTPGSGGGVHGPLIAFFLRVLLGGGVGFVGGLALAIILRLDLVSRDHTNIVVLTGAVLLFGICDELMAESGILAVIVAGLTVRVFRPPQLSRLKRFKLELTELGIGLLFILLSARLDVEQFTQMGTSLIALVAVVVFVLRPLNIGVSTWGQSYTLREKVFLSWIAPRGIVAAAMASLFALKLEALGLGNAQVLQTFTFAVIGTTVLLQGFTAGWVARLLRLERPPRNTWMLTGEPTVATALARGLGEAGASAIVVDPAVSDTVATAGVTAIQGSPLSSELMDDGRLLPVGAVLSISPDAQQNRIVSHSWGDVVGREHCFRLDDTVPDAGDGAPPDEPTEGIVVWRELSDPRDLAHALGRDEVAVSVVEGRGKEDQGRFHQAFAPLFTVGGGMAEVVVDPERFDSRPGQTIVVLRRRVPGLEGLVRTALVIEEDDADLTFVVRRLLLAAGELDPSLPIDELLRDTVERERSMSTAMGLGVIIPHTYHPGLGRTQCVVANVCCGLSSDTPGGELIHLVFLVLSPGGQAEAHLQSLAAIARLVSDSGFRALLGNAPTAERLLDLIRERE